MNMYLKGLAVAATLTLLPITSYAAPTTEGPGGFNNYFATEITYDKAALRGTTNGRDNALNALGSDNTTFFEIGLGSYAEFTFGRLFSGPTSVVEFTFGRGSSPLETAKVFTRMEGGEFTFAGTIDNNTASSVVAIGMGPFDALRIEDTSAAGGGFDIASVKVSPVPLPAAGMLLLSVLGGLGMMRRRKSDTKA